MSSPSPQSGFGSRHRLCIIGFGGADNPSTRQRALVYAPAFEETGYRVRSVFVQSGVLPRRLGEVLRVVRGADVVLVQRVLTWWLLPLLRAARVRIVYDFDDAIYSIRQGQVARALSPESLRDWVMIAYRTVIRGDRLASSRRRPLRRMLKAADLVIAGNETLAAWVGGSARTVVLPTAAAVAQYPVRVHTGSRVVRIGWIGVPSNLIHLGLIDAALSSVRERYGDRVRLVVVSSRAPGDLPIPVEFIPWTLAGESAAVSTFDIGIMPLQDDVFSRGKCSFKAIFCMAHGVPVVISPVGMNTDLVQNGVNGFLAATASDWTRSLSALIDDVSLRAALGAEARRTIERRYDTRAVASELIGLIDGLLNSDRSHNP